MTPDILTMVLIGIAGIIVQGTIRIWFLKRRIRRMKLCEERQAGTIEALREGHDKLWKARHRLEAERNKLVHEMGQMHYELAWARTLPGFDEALRERQRRDVEDRLAARRASDEAQLQKVNSLINQSRAQAQAIHNAGAHAGMYQPMGMVAPTFAPAGTPVRGGGPFEGTGGFSGRLK